MPFGFFGDWRAVHHVLSTGRFSNLGITEGLSVVKACHVCRFVVTFLCGCQFVQSAIRWNLGNFTWLLASWYGWHLARRILLSVNKDTRGHGSCSIQTCTRAISTQSQTTPSFARRQIRLCCRLLGVSIGTTWIAKFRLLILFVVAVAIHHIRRVDLELFQLGLIGNAKTAEVDQTGTGKETGDTIAHLSRGNISAVIALFGPGFTDNSLSQPLHTTIQRNFLRNV